MGTYRPGTSQLQAEIDAVALQVADTGWRTIVEWNTAGVFSIGSFASVNFAPRTGSAGWVRIRRLGSFIRLATINVQAGASPISVGQLVPLVTLPIGFAPTTTESASFFQGPGNYRYSPDSTDLRFQFTASFTAGQLIVAANPSVAEWITDQSYPDPLPGIAA